MKKIKIMLALLLIPFNVYAYSSSIIAGGENIGINVSSNGILVVGFYKVEGKDVKTNPEITIGDYIIKINNKEVNSILELTKTIEENIKDGAVTLTVRRGNEEKDIKMDLVLSNNIYKTGLYVKDSLSGIGTLTYIDPETRKFGSLGHEIIESNTNSKIEVKTGTIFNSEVTGITKSTDGAPGEKEAKLKTSDVYGKVNKNTKYGLFGDFTKDLPDKRKYEVGTYKDVKIGNAKILTTLKDNEIKEYDINITKINEYNKTKNIYFEITDKKLLGETGGIVQGMSGSPIIQNDKIIGAVTHVIVDNVKTGYGIFITTMLEEGEN